MNSINTTQKSPTCRTSKTAMMFRWLTRAAINASFTADCAGVVEASARRTLTATTSPVDVTRPEYTQPKLPPPKYASIWTFEIDTGGWFAGSSLASKRLLKETVERSGPDNVSSSIDTGAGGSPCHSPWGFSEFASSDLIGPATGCILNSLPGT